MNTNNEPDNFNDNDYLNELLSIYNNLYPEYKELLIEQSKALLNLQRAKENSDLTY